MRVNRGVWLLVCLLLAVSASVAQSPNGTISGIVLDPSGGLIVGANVLIINNATGAEYPGKANSEGYYVVPNIPPGTYRIQVSNSGFKTIIKPDIVIHVQDALAINFTLPIGAASELVTVEGGAPLINTTDASVSTIVDRKFVENMPLNGRSFQDLILLTPGVVTNTPQSVTSFVGYSGEFSVNGQRTESNYYSVDGVAANVGIAAGATSAAGTSGSVAGATALGTTQSLVSVDALQEFRVQSSSYSAEYGRNPGGQFSFVTRSGTNQWHGTAFDYLRNGVFDANDWFNNYYRVPPAGLQQNDFGGTLGGPVHIPHLYDGRDKTFFFVSYEGLRLTQPQPASINYVPSHDLRLTAAAALQPILNAFPLPTPGQTDLGNGLAEFVDSWSNPSSIDAISVRFDHSIGESTKLFFRFADTSSSTEARQSGNFGTPSQKVLTDFLTRSYTFGINNVFLAGLANELRVNYLSNRTTYDSVLDSLGGAIPVNVVELQGINPATNPFGNVGVNLSIGGYYPGLNQGLQTGEQRQWNIVENLSVGLGRHQLRFGADYRRLAPIQNPFTPSVQYSFFSEASVQANSADIAYGSTNASAYPVYTNFSAYAQDEWQASSRLHVSGGLRWEVNPAPGASQGSLPYTVTSTNLATMTLAPSGTPLWHTAWFNLAPRLGIAYVLRAKPSYETVIRAGVGVFYDTAQQAGSYGYTGLGFSNYSYVGSVFGIPASFPLAPGVADPGLVNPPVAPYTNSTIYAYPTHLQLPYTLQWNTTVEQGLGKDQALTVSYVGSHGDRLLEQDQYYATPINPNFGYVIFFRNGLTSDYNALQIQFQRRMVNGLSALASYTFSHSIDYGSTNIAFPYQRGDSDFDVRHSVSGAISYDVSRKFENKIVQALLGHWGVDVRFTARTAFPVTLNGSGVFDPATERFAYGGLDLVPGEPVYLYAAQYPGGRAINPNAFSQPAYGAYGDAPRNFTRGFGASQMDLAIRREFPIAARWRLQFRAEAFNVFNHPNFGTINPYFFENTFGQATATLAQSLGVLSPLYQTGGARSMQFALKLMF